MIFIFANIIWILYACIDGFKDGFYWHFKNTSLKNYKFEIHPIFSLQRGIVLLAIGTSLYYTIGIYSLLSTLSMILMFSFFHNGMYYYIRNKLDSNIYKLKWKDQSITSTAKLTKIMTYENRTIFMIIGTLLQIFILYKFFLYN